MTNNYSPCGGKALDTLIATNFTGKVNKYTVNSTDMTDLWCGDAVKLVGGSDDNGIPYITKAAAGEKLVGFVSSIKNIYPNEDIIYRQGGDVVNVYVYDDPFMEFEIQANGNITAADIGKEANLAVEAGNAAVGVSRTQVDVATLGVSPSQIKIIDIIEREGNILGDYTKLRCIITNHAFKDLAEDIFDRDAVTGNITTHNAGDSLELDGELTVNNNATIDGKLTVTGLIDPTGLALDAQALAPATTNGTIFYSSVSNSFQFRADSQWVSLPQPFPVINVAADFPFLSAVYLGETYRIGNDVTDNDPTRTNTGQSFPAGSEIFWNNINWTLVGAIALWGDDGTRLTPINARNVNILTGQAYQINSLDFISAPGTNNACIGFNTDGSLTTGSENIFIGTDAGSSTTTGSQNVYVGYQAGKGGVDAQFNLCMGYTSGSSLTSASNNVFMGNSSGKNTTTGGYNVFIGASAGLQTTTGTNNICIGYKAGRVNNDNSQVFIGYQAAMALVTGSCNILIGCNVGSALTSGNNNVILGWGAAATATTSVGNTLVGANTGFSFTTSTNNVCVGLNAGYGTSTASNSVYIGYNAGYTANSNSLVLIGYLAGEDLGTALNNVFIGSAVGKEIIGGDDNVLIGNNVATTALASTSNTIVGSHGGFALTTGTTNTILGHYAGGSLTNHTGNVLIGYNAGKNLAASNKLYISNSDTATPLIEGDFSVPNVIINGTLRATNLTASSLIGANASKDIVTITALPDGTTATTQAPGDNSTKVATTAYVEAAVLVENLWDRAGTVISPHTSGDSLSINAIDEETGGSGVTIQGVVIDETGANSFTMTRGTSVLTVSSSCTLDQSLAIADSPTHSGLTLSSLNVAGGIVQTNGSGVLSSSTALPDGTTATTQAPGDNSTKVATTAYVEAAVGVESMWDRAGTVISPHTDGDSLNVNAINEQSGASGVRIQGIQIDEGGANTFVMIRGITLLSVTATCTLNQNLSTTSDVDFKTGTFTPTTFVPGVKIVVPSAVAGSTAFLEIDTTDVNDQSMVQFDKAGTMTWQLVSRNEIDAGENDRLSFYDASNFEVGYFKQDGGLRVIGLNGVTPLYSEVYIDAKNQSRLYSGLLWNQLEGNLKMVDVGLRLSKSAWNADMDGSGIAMTFDLAYNSTPDYDEMGRIYCASETDWTSTAASRDAYMMLQVARDGVSRDGFKIDSNQETYIYNNLNVMVGSVLFSDTSGQLISMSPGVGNAVHIGCDSTGYDTLAFNDTFGTILSSSGSAFIMIDTDNSGTDAYLSVRGNGTNPGGTSSLFKVYESGEIEIYNEGLYFGDIDSNDTWRIIRSGNNLVIERRETGSYVTKDTIIP